MKNLLLLTCSLFALASCQASLGKGPLDGRVYDVTLTGTDQKTAADQLIFDGGRFESTMCRSHGFHGGSYSSSADTFESTPKGTQGTTAWNGALKGEGIEGSMTWTDSQGKQSQYRFTGKKSTGILDGQTFEGQVCPKGQKTGDKDRLTFANGGFDSSACRSYGFTITNYVATRDGDAVHFNADATNAGGDVNHWEGTIRGAAISGTLQSKDPNGKVVYDFDFEAKRAN